MNADKWYGVDGNQEWRKMDDNERMGMAYLSPWIRVMWKKEGFIDDPDWVQKWVRVEQWGQGFSSIQKSIPFGGQREPESALRSPDLTWTEVVM